MIGATVFLVAVILLVGKIIVDVQIAKIKVSLVGVLKLLGHLQLMKRQSMFLQS